MGTSWANDPVEGLVGILLTNQLFSGPVAPTDPPGLLDQHLHRVAVAVLASDGLPSDESARPSTVGTACPTKRSTASPSGTRSTATRQDRRSSPCTAASSPSTRSFGDVLPWLTEGRRVIGVELQGHGHTPDTGRAMSIERFADDVAELIDRVAGGGPVDVWGFSLGALTATSLALRHPAKVRRLVLAASNIRPDGYHPEITAPEQDDPRLPTEEEFATWQADYEAVAPNPADFFPFLERMQPVVHDFAGWTADEIRSITAPTFLVIGDRDFVRLDHAAEMLDLFPDCRLAVLPATRHTEVMQRTDELRALVGPFLS